MYIYVTKETYIRDNTDVYVWQKKKETCTWTKEKFIHCLFSAYVYVHIYEHKYMCICVWLCIWIHIYIHMRVCIYIFMNIHMCVHACVCVHVYRYGTMQRHCQKWEWWRCSFYMNTYMHMKDIYLHIWVYMCIYCMLNIYTRIYTHVYV